MEDLLELHKSMPAAVVVMTKNLPVTRMENRKVTTSCAALNLAHGFQHSE